MKSFSIKKILILVTILAVPGFLYYLLQEKGKNRYKTLSFFGPKKLAGTFHSVRGKKIADTLYHAVADFKLTDQDGKETDLSRVNDKIYVVNLFYAKDNFPTKVAHATISALYKSHEKNKRLRFLSITTDPENDTPEKLKAFSETLRSDGRWSFFTGSQEKVYSIIKNGLLLDAENDGKISYSNMLVLLDHKLQIRGYYDATNREATARLDDEIKVLMAEELRNVKDGR